MFYLVTQYVMLHCVVLLIWLLEIRFLVTLLESVWICFFLSWGSFRKNHIMFYLVTQ